MHLKKKSIATRTSTQKEKNTRNCNCNNRVFARMTRQKWKMIVANRKKNAPQKIELNNFEELDYTTRKYLFTLSLELVPVTFNKK